MEYSSEEDKKCKCGEDYIASTPSVPQVEKENDTREKGRMTTL